jgi:hypothetical protein
MANLVLGNGLFSDLSDGRVCDNLAIIKTLSFMRLDSESQGTVNIRALTLWVETVADGNCLQIET